MLKGAVVAGAVLSVLDGIQTGLKTKGNAAAKLEAGAQRAGEGMLDTVTAGLYSAIGPKVTGLIIKHSSDEFKRKLGGDKSFARVVAESSTGEALFGGSRTKEQAKILKQMDEQRRNRRAALSHEEVAIYKQLLERKKIGEKLTDYQKKILETHKRDFELREKSLKNYEKTATSKQVVDAARWTESQGDVEGITDPEKRNKVAIRGMLRSSEELRTEKGTAELKAMLSGKKGDWQQQASLNLQLRKMGVTREGMLKHLPQEAQGARIASGMVGVGGTTKEQVSAYEAMMDRRAKAGLTEDGFAAGSAIAAGQRKGMGNDLNIKIKGDGEEAVAQEGKLNSTTSTIKYALPGSVLEIGIDNIVKGINNFTTNNPPPTNTSKV